MDYKQEAEKIVKIFYPHAYDEGQQCMPVEMHEKSRRWHSIQCAIKHVEGIQKAYIMGFSDGIRQSDSSILIDEYADLLNQLKQM